MISNTVTNDTKISFNSNPQGESQVTKHIFEMGDDFLRLILNRLDDKDLQNLKLVNKIFYKLSNNLLLDKIFQKKINPLFNIFFFQCQDSTFDLTDCKMLVKEDLKKNYDFLEEKEGFWSINKERKLTITVKTYKEIKNNFFELVNKHFGEVDYLRGLFSDRLGANGYSEEAIKILKGLKKVTFFDKFCQSAAEAAKNQHLDASIIITKAIKDINTRNKTLKYLFHTAINKARFAEAQECIELIDESKWKFFNKRKYYKLFKEVKIQADTITKFIECQEFKSAFGVVNELKNKKLGNHFFQVMANKLIELKRFREAKICLNTITPSHIGEIIKIEERIKEIEGLEKQQH
ncbi:MAG: hypothetical protein Tsb0021_13360 [Chlamydiales bacterium]